MKKKRNLFFVRILLFSGILVLSTDPAQAQKKEVKIFVNTDLEGISGVYKFAQTREKDSPLNIQACEYFMGDLAAVIHGLRDGGATQVVVLDGHGNQAVIPHLMDPGATWITGQPKSGRTLDSTFAGMCQIGFHAMNGTVDGVLHHTQSSKTEHKYWYNGVEWGEIAQNAASAGYYDVATIMVSGDEATCREARRFFGSEIVTVATKRGLSREAAELYPFELTRKALYEGAKKAMSQISKCKPFKPQLPLQAKMQWIDADGKVQTKEGVVTNVRRITNF